MNHKAKFACLLFVGTGLLSPITVQAEVKSLTSSELTDTYIKDSTIIVTPKKKKNVAKKKTYSSLTIAPVENTIIDIDQLKSSQDHLDGKQTAFELTDEILRNASVESALNPLQEVEIQSFQETITKPIAELLDDPRYTVPEGDFEIPYMGDRLGLSRQGDQLKFSLGSNIPGIENVNLPQGINEGPLQIEPRVGGGFDLTINIPQD